MRHFYVHLAVNEKGKNMRVEPQKNILEALHQNTEVDGRGSNAVFLVTRVASPPVPQMEMVFEFKAYQVK